MISALIVDDDATTADAIRDTVEWEGLGIGAVFTALNVTRAEKFLQEEKIDIIISDIEMPRDTGLDLLQWVRDRKLDCEFLFLTCHENFNYASNAINNGAAAYLTKPFNKAVMELNLRKLVAKLAQRESNKKNSSWVEKNIRRIQLDFWKLVLEGELADEEQIDTEITNRNLDIDRNGGYCLVYSKISNTELDFDKFGRNMFEYIMENFHSELLTNKLQNESVVKERTDDMVNFITVCPYESGTALQKNCDRLIETCKKYFRSIVTCCVSRKYSIYELAAARKKIENLFIYKVGSFGKVFLEENMSDVPEYKEHIIDPDKMLSFIRKKDKTSILHYLKNLFYELSSLNRLNMYSLYMVKQEMMQMVYADLIEQKILATKLFCDELSIRMENRATDSTVDMIRWINYLLEKTFKYENELSKPATIVDRIDTYIREHYTERIGRNELAEKFFLNPEYLAKFYKRKTGTSLNYAINSYRVEKAKELLQKGEDSISDIALDVGFESFSYFSTVFKKITGTSPKGYQRK